MAKYTTKHVKKRKAKNTKIIKIIIILLIAFIAIKVFSKDKAKDISLIINNEEVTESLSYKLMEIDDVIYMSFEDIEKFIDQTIYQEDDGLIITTSSKKVASLEYNTNTITINGASKTISAGVIEGNKTYYIPISELQEVYDIDFSYSKDSNIATIDDLSKELVEATAKNNIKIKENTSIFSKTLDKVKKGEQVVYLSEENGWSKVRTKDGYIGYVKSTKLTNITTKRENFKEENMLQVEDYLEKDITAEDISDFYKRQKIINSIFTEAINSDKMKIKFIYKNQSEDFERFKIESEPIFKECGMQCEFIQE